MSNFAVLDKNKHKNLRVAQGRGAEFGENVHLVPVIAEELNKLIIEYPVCLVKDNNTGQFGLQALLGFEPQENLFLCKNQWQANYLPLHIRRQPFMVAVNNKAGEQPSAENTVITVNMNNTRVQEEEGELLFDESGNPTSYLNEINQLLSTLVNGINQTQLFIHTISEYELIEKVQVNVAFKSGEKKYFDGIYTINADKLKQLNAEQLIELNQKGYLQACYLLLASIGNIQKLINLKNNN